MAYMSILTYCDSEKELSTWVRTAADLTRVNDAHLTVMALGYEPDIPPYAMADISPAVLDEGRKKAREAVDALSVKISEMLAKEGVRSDVVPMVGNDVQLSAAFGEAARFADLVVVGQPYNSGFEEAAVPLVEAAMFDGDAATLVCPLEPTKVERERALIGWNGSREGHRAVRRALPLLTKVKNVEVAVIDPGKFEEQSAKQLALVLSRHGIDVSVNFLPNERKGVAEIIRERVLDFNADMLVMGAYTHSRFRESVLGGVTRNILSDVPVPVLMAH